MWKIYTNSNPNKLDLSKHLPSGLYSITNLRSATINPPIDSNAACVIFSSPITEILIGSDSPLAYGRFKGGGSDDTKWTKLL